MNIFKFGDINASIAQLKGNLIINGDLSV